MKSTITEKIVQLIRETSSSLPEDILKAIKAAQRREAKGSSAAVVLKTILDNCAIARKRGTPLCQDTGTLTFFVDESLRRKVTPAVLKKAVALATERGYLRKNTIDSITGKSYDDNVCEGAPVIHYVEPIAKPCEARGRISVKCAKREDVFHFRKVHFTEMHQRGGFTTASVERAEDEGRRVKGEGCVTLVLKGGGSENMSRQYSLPDAALGAGRDLAGVRKCVLDAVQKIQGYGCAPGILGVCIGGDRATGYEVAKEQLLRPLDEKTFGKEGQTCFAKFKQSNNSNNQTIELASLESQLLREANSLGIGPMGLGGRTTLLGVKIAARPRVPASFFVTVAYMCWACRRRTIIL